MQNDYRTLILETLFNKAKRSVSREEGENNFF